VEDGHLFIRPGAGTQLYCGPERGIRGMSELISGRKAIRKLIMNAGPESGPDCTRFRHGSVQSLEADRLIDAQDSAFLRLYRCL
jgi:hypothetical protein